MKIGTIRRIDDLGRVVIPKTVRKALNIKTGDNLEIYIESENIILKKYSEMGKIGEIGLIVSSVLEEKLKVKVYITDRDKVISNTEDKDTISKELQEIIGKRKIEERQELKITDKLTTEGNTIICPVLTNGDIIGSIIVFKKEDISKDELEIIKSFNLLLNKIQEN